MDTIIEIAAIALLVFLPSFLIYVFYAIYRSEIKEISLARNKFVGEKAEDVRKKELNRVMENAATVPEPVSLFSSRSISDVKSNHEKISQYIDILRPGIENLEDPNLSEAREIVISLSDANNRLYNLNPEKLREVRESALEYQYVKSLRKATEQLAKVCTEEKTRTINIRLAELEAVTEYSQQSRLDL